MKHVYFVRHGQTKYNLESRVQPSTSELDAVGLMQAEKIANRVANLGITTMIASDFKRAKQTADIIAESNSLSYECSSLFGEARPPSSLHEYARASPEYKRYSETYHEHYLNPEWHFEDEENFFDLVKRCTKAKEYVESLRDETILIVTHGLFLRYFLGVALFGEELEPEFRRKFHRKFSQSNVGLSLFTVADDTGWELVVWNDHSHLG